MNGLSFFTIMFSFLFSVFLHAEEAAPKAPAPEVAAPAAAKPAVEKKPEPKPPAPQASDAKPVSEKLTPAPAPTKTDKPTPEVAQPAPPKPAPPAKPVLAESLIKWLPEKLIRKDGSEVPRELLAGKVVGLYFAAKWGAPCRAFTPTLVKFRAEHQQDFEVVFISSDKDFNAQKEFMTAYKMDWFAVPKDRAESNTLQQYFSVGNIPTLVIIGADGKELTRDGRTIIQREYKTALSKWKK